MVSNRGKRITEYDMGPMNTSAFTTVSTMDNITHGFEKVRSIHKFNPNIFTRCDFTPAEALNAVNESNWNQQDQSDNISIPGEKYS